MLVLDQTFVFSPEQAKTQWIVPFTLENPCRTLRITSRYFPKDVSDKILSKHLICEATAMLDPNRALTNEEVEAMLPLRNLITLSLDYEDMFIGSAHRHASLQHYEICFDHPSEGFERFAPRAGQWRAVLSLHAVMIPVTYHIQIDSVEDETP